MGQEARDQLLSTKCFTDPEVWAGKGNVDALARQFPETLVKRGPDPQLLQIRDIAKLHVRDAIEGSSCAEGSLNVSSSCAHLGQLEVRLENYGGASEAYEAALQHALAAQHDAPADWARSAFWRASVAHSQAAAYFGLRRFKEGKSSASEALAAATEALLTEEGDASESLAWKW